MPSITCEVNASPVQHTHPPARRAASVRVMTSSLARIAETCRSTVFGDSYGRSALSVLRGPAARCCSTSRPTEVAQQVECRLVGPVDIIEDNQRRLPPGQPVQDGPEDPLARTLLAEQPRKLATDPGRRIDQRPQRARRRERVATAAQHPHRPAHIPAQRLNQRQARLPDPAGTSQRQKPDIAAQHQVTGDGGFTRGRSAASTAPAMTRATRVSRASPSVPLSATAIRPLDSTGWKRQ